MDLRDEGMKPKTKAILAVGGVLVLLTIFVTLILVVAIGDSKTKSDDDSDQTAKTLAQAMDIDDMMNTLEEFQNIAYANNGSRTAITGYNASVDYVVQQLQKNTNYNVTLQYFTFLFFQELAVPVFQQTEPEEVRYINNQDFRNLRYGGSGNVTAQVAYVGGGCNVSDYSSFTPGYIALMARNYLTDCSLQEKIDMADDRGAQGVLVYYDPGTTGLFGSGLKELAPFPAFSLTYDLGMFLIELTKENLTVNMYAETEAPPVGTMNIIADTLTGDPNSTIVVGSHLDSVPAGPGINDNGSGSSVNLEMAIELYKQKIKLSNRVRFAWWAAEEFGLLGSTYYVGSLTPEDKSQIALNLNFDMEGSPNFFRGIYNGSGASQDIVKGCIFLQNIFEDWFAQEGLFYDLTPFTGRSDYGPFITNGIPAGGLDTGAEKIKTAEQRSRYGGLANTAFDPCYHLGCDTVENINQAVLRDMAQAAANALQYLATLADLRSYLS
eukprot:CAMPEP_0168564744 /NCGR_PEP_ID=MMETSP0413-20121227/13420_1 /TAXON_ID=136452 /ORGANISM="Filamoeba nolandi, Strain NC-AS-23-1" /LENGTH=493 /DNA_ID=CAMNT_0008596459 /DNA_START=40 /DNA_END=1521 /DNA_ORIENTATION=-